MVNVMHKELEALRDWIGFYVDTDATPSQQTIKGIYDKLDVLLREDGWQPIETAPKDRLVSVWIAGTNSAGERWCDDVGEMWVYCYYDSICGQWRTTRPSGYPRCVPERFVTHWQQIAPPAFTGDSRR